MYKEEVREKLPDLYKYYSSLIYSKGHEQFFVGIPFIPYEKIKKVTIKDCYKYIVNPEEEYRPDILSFKFYKRTDLDWVICYCNNIKDPIKELVRGKILYIPKIEIINSLFLDYEENYFIII